MALWLLGVCQFQGGARAQQHSPAPTLYILRPRDQPASGDFVESVQIQARDRVVKLGGVLDSLSQPIDSRVAVLCAEHPGATLVWTASEPEGTGLGRRRTFHAVSCATGRAGSDTLLDEAGSDAAQVRTWALKALSLASMLEQPAAPHDPEEGAKDGEALPIRIAIAGAVAAWALPPLQHGRPFDVGLSGAVGAKLLLGSGSVGALASLRVQPNTSSNSEEGAKLSASSISPGVSILAAYTLSSVVLSLELSMWARLLSLDGETSSGSAGSASTAVPQVQLTAGLGYDLVAGLVAEVRAGALCNLIRRRLAVGTDTLGDTGTCGALAALGLRY